MLYWESSFKKLIKYKKYRELYDIHKIECWGSVVVTGAILSVCYRICYILGVIEFIDIFAPILMDIGIAMIGFLGFVVGGLAILTGLISSKVMGKLIKDEKIEPLERILLSFYLLGIICAIFIFGTIVLYFFSHVPAEAVFIATIIATAIMTYLLSFIVIYSTKLIGDSIDLFIIMSRMATKLEDNTDTNEVQKNRDSYVDKQ